MGKERFLPLFITQFLGALNDNLFRTSVSVLVAYGLWDIGTWQPEVLVSIAAGVFILPFILFAPLAGEMADKFDKAFLIRRIKIAEIVIVLVALLGLLVQSVLVLMLVLFFLGAQSAFFSPSKFSILPQHLQHDELIGGNALINTGTYLAILAGTIIGSLLALSGIGLFFVGAFLLVFALAGYTASRGIPDAPPPAPQIKLNYNTFTEAMKSIRFAAAQKGGVFIAILGTSWFYFVGAMMLSQFPNFARQTLYVDNFVLTFFMVIFSIGIAAGGLLNNRMLRSKVEATFVPLAGLGIAFFAMELYFASLPYNPETLPAGTDFIGLDVFLAHFAGWRIIFDLFALSVMGGLYVVPLKSIVQDRIPADHRARVLASSALIDALFILAASLMASIMLSGGMRVEELFLTTGLLTLPVAGFMVALVPKAVRASALTMLKKGLKKNV